jgi:hypothetical protein
VYSLIIEYPPPPAAAKSKTVPVSFLKNKELPLAKTEPYPARGVAAVDIVTNWASVNIFGIT